MITSYKDIYFETLKEKIKEYDITYLKKTNDFDQNYVYIIDDMPIGLISFSIIYERIELNYIWVDKIYRKQGIATQMIDFMCNTKDIINITLEVSKNNTKAINLYKKKGFEVVSTRKNYYGSQDAYLMMKEMI